MTLIEILQDHTIRAVRKDIWADPQAHLVLPDIVDGLRTPWCTLHELGKTKAVYWGDVESGDTADDWEPYTQRRDP